MVQWYGFLDVSINEGKVVTKISKLIDKDFRSQGIFGSVSDYVGIKPENIVVFLCKNAIMLLVESKLYFL